MNWDDAKYFLAVARTGQMLGAAKRLGVSQATLNRRITALETALSVKLFERSTSGCVLTREGQALAEISVRIEEEFLRAQDALQGRSEHLEGTIRIGVPDGFGVAYLAPRLPQLHKTFPALNIQLVATPRGFSLSQRDADIAIMVGRPEKGRLRVQKLTDYSLSLYAAQSYLAGKDHPTASEDLASHSLVGYVEDLIFADDLAYAGHFSKAWKSQFEISNVLGQFEAVRAGAGIGILHDFMATSDPDLVSLIPATQLTLSYWTVWHESMSGTKRVFQVTRALNQMARRDQKLFLPQRTRG